MNNFLILAYGLYIVAATVKGRGDDLRKNFSADLAGFVPWIISIGVLALFSENEKTRPLVGPFVTLALIAMVLKQEKTVETEVRKIWSHYTTGAAL